MGVWEFSETARMFGNCNRSTVLSGGFANTTIDVGALCQLSPRMVCELAKQLRSVSWSVAALPTHHTALCGVGKTYFGIARDICPVLPQRGAVLVGGACPDDPFPVFGDAEKGKRDKKRWTIDSTKTWAPPGQDRWWNTNCPPIPTSVENRKLPAKPRLLILVP
jgi:hypothetical protein